MKKPMSFWVFLVSGISVLVCIPLILISEKLGFPDDPYHFIQMILVPVCLVSGVWYSTRRKAEKGRFEKYLVGIGIVLCGLFMLLVGYLIFGPIVTDYYHRERFDAELWRSEEGFNYEGMWPHRLCMVDNLMSSGKLDGLTRNQVVELLGLPHSKEFPHGAVDCDIHYYLGPERGFIGIDSEWLFIKFDNNGRVVKYWIYTD
ncbi:MAG: hypothetical protein JW806_09590 [Sedimentisphaerales bacterium]|nr:hypothetical protein [Sedimentisphaerales bacterium]